MPRILQRRRYGLAGAVTALLAGAAAQRNDGENTILYPDSAALTFNYLDTVVVDFETDYATPWLYLFCEQASSPLEIVYYSPSDLGNNTRQFLLNYDYMPTAGCWFNLRPAQRESDDNSTDVGASSPEFSYTSAEGDKKTFSLTSTASSPATTPTTTNPGASGANSANPDSAPTPTTPSEASESSASEGLSAGAKAGIGVGVSALGLALIAAVAWVLMSRRRQKDQLPELHGESRGGEGIDAQSTTPASSAGGKETIGGFGSWHSTTPSQNGHEPSVYHELPVDQRNGVHELESPMSQPLQGRGPGGTPLV